MRAPPRVGGAWLEAPETQGVLAMLAGAGHRALAVGGCVRNALLGAPVADVDIATDARPERVTALAEAAGLQAVPTGIEHGTVTVVANGVPHEVTTFRRDVETDGRRAVVAFSDDVAEDAARRDFTVNALYAERDGRVVDPLGGGLPDLRARRVRFIGDAEARIREDALRILRFFRFHAWYGDPERGLDAAGLAACARLAPMVDRLSAERVGAEMKRLLLAPDPAASLRAMEEAGVLARLAPGAEAGPVAPLVALEAGREPSWVRRLLAMGGEDVAERWRLSRAEARRLGALREARAAGTPAAEVAYRHGAGAGLDLALARAAVVAAADPSGTEARAGLRRIGAPDAPSGDQAGAASAEVAARARVPAEDAALFRDGLTARGPAADGPERDRRAGPPGGAPGAAPPEAVAGPDPLRDALARAEAARFPLRAVDLMPALRGPALGAALKRAEAAWIASGFALDREALRRIALEAAGA